MSPTPFDAILPAERIHQQALLKEYATMRTGGPADYLLEPRSEEEICSLLRQCAQAGIEAYVLGNGSNVLFSDDGFRGAVLHLGKHFGQLNCSGSVLHAQAGALLSAAARLAADSSLTGMEFAAGIPGSVGGAVCMNAGAYGGEISQVLQEARVLYDGSVCTWRSDDMDFAYRHSAVMKKGAIVLSANFALVRGEKRQIENQMRELNRRRREKQPLQYPSCGSFFKRPEGHYAGALIEEAGLKGYAIGDAQVSELHAGFIINRCRATSAQIYDLMQHVQQRVYAFSGVMLEPEVRLIGRFDP